MYDIGGGSSYGMGEDEAVRTTCSDLAPAGLAVTSYHAAYGMLAGNTGYDEQGHLLLAEDPRNKERKKK